jgi:hypothetical protein
MKNEYQSKIPAAEYKERKNAQYLSEYIGKFHRKKQTSTYIN